ncbi:hypothetical protein SACS_0370 [Parasaccharibacter apium]|uniref:Uncharacterized protein n=1 Tax=Parasaccharibacter apium TaxID=1510841 RepID=A0A7U7G4Q8_9PROT|nr:hypothetical protein SACS_0370 [Parasaccharibacter apium]
MAVLSVKGAGLSCLALSLRKRKSCRNRYEGGTILSSCSRRAMGEGRKG